MCSLLTTLQGKQQNGREKSDQGDCKTRHQTRDQTQTLQIMFFHKVQQMTTVKQLRSFRHNIFSIKLNKIGLSPFDNKRYILGNGCVTLAYGHCA